MEKYLLQLPQGFQGPKESPHAEDMLRNPETLGKDEPLTAEEWGGRFRSQTPTVRGPEIQRQIATQAARDKRGGTREGAGGCRKILGRPVDIRALRPNSQHPSSQADQSPTRSDLGAARKLQAALGQPRVPQAQRCHLGSVRSGPGQGMSLRVPSVRTRQDPGLQQPP